MKTPEDEAFDELAKKQGAWGGGFQAKRKMAADKLQEPPSEWASIKAILDEYGLQAIDFVADFKAALAQPAQESWREFASDYERGFIDGMQKQAQSSVDKAVNQMAQRPWVGLTDEEIKEIVGSVGAYGDAPIKGYTRKLFDQIEAKLRSKNT